MNKANFRDLFKSLAIILLFVVIIGLIIITTHPDKFKEIIFGKKITEGMGAAEFHSDCFRCGVTPQMGNAFTIQRINQEIINNRARVPSNVLPRDGNAFNLYMKQGDSFDLSYVFCSWDGIYSTTSSNWLDKCKNYMYNDASCCTKDDGSQTDFYKGNYITDTTTGEKYYGIVFKFKKTGTTQVTSSDDLALSNSANARTISNDIFEFTPMHKKDDKQPHKLYDNSLEYTTTISSENEANDLKISQDTNGNPTHYIDCSGSKIEIPTPEIPSWATCNLSQVTSIPNSQVMELAKDQQLCWNIGQTFGELSMNYYCISNNIALENCPTIYQPRPDANTLTPPIDSLFSGGSSGAGTSGTGTFGSDTGLPSTFSQEIQSQLQTATDNLVKQFQDKLANLNNNLGQPEYPNIGNPTYLNIGTCGNNSPYVYNSSCTNTKTSETGGFLYQYQCYPSLTGQFEECGPQGYNPRPDF